MSIKAKPAAFPCILNDRAIKALCRGQKTQARWPSNSLLARAKPGDILYTKEVFAPVAWDGGKRVFILEYQADRARVCRRSVDLFPEGMVEEYENRWIYGLKCWGADTFGRGSPERIALPDDAHRKWRIAKMQFRGAARFDLKIVSVKKEPLQNMTDADAYAEGILLNPLGADFKAYNYRDHKFYTLDDNWTYRTSFASLWDNIYEDRGLGWVKNPEVVRIAWDPIEQKKE